MYKTLAIPFISRKSLIAFIVILFVFLVTWMSFWNSPNGNEPGHLAAGIYTLRYGRNDLYRVNPPLTRMIASVPAAFFLKIDADWLSTATNVLSYRPEYEVGKSLYFKNDPDRLYYAFAQGRVMLLPFSLLGAWVCYRFSSEIFGCNAGLAALILWCFNPYVLTWSATINPDIAAASAGIFAFYLFWRWLRVPSLQRSVWLGVALGILLVTKTVWIIVFVLWPILWTISFTTSKERSFRRGAIQTISLCIVFVLGIFILNLFYNFSGSLRPLKEYSFLSASLQGDRSESDPVSKNRFLNTRLENIPVPFPEDYIYGIDVQKFDFERGIPSYLNGVWSEKGYVSFYLYAILLKTPVGFELLFLLALILVFKRRYRSTPFNEIFLFLPLIAILALISSQNGFSIHSRYLLPLLPFLIIGTSRIGLIFQGEYSLSRSSAKIALLSQTAITILILWGVIGSLTVFPHCMSYFNEWIGGPAHGGEYLLGSDNDWGQDVYYLHRWQKNHPEARPLRISLFGTAPLEKTGIQYDGIVPKEGDNTNIISALKPGWYAIDQNLLFNRSGDYAGFREKDPIDRAGWTINIYYFSEEEIDRLRKRCDLPPIKEEYEKRSILEKDLLLRKNRKIDPVTIAIYNGKGTASDSAATIQKILSESGYACMMLDEKAIQSDQLIHCNAIVVPGGTSLEMGEALGDNGRENIRSFVRSGGGYVGICAGAFLASTTFERFLNLVNVKTNHYEENMPLIGRHEQRNLGVSPVLLEFSDQGQDLFSCVKKETLEYINGPIFIEGGQIDLPFYLVLATFRSDIYQYHYQQGTMPNTPAIVAGKYGNGYVVLFSPHPELTKGKEIFLIDAVNMTRRKRTEESLVQYP